MHAAANMHQHAHAKCNLSHGQVKPSASIQQKGNATTQSGTQIQTVYLHAYSCQMQIGYLHVYMLSMPDQLSVLADARRSQPTKTEWKLTGNGSASEVISAASKNAGDQTCSKD